MAAKGVQKVPPDGGWGWLVVFGSSLINLSTRSIEPSFGLLFGDVLRDLGVATTGAAVIMSGLDAVVNFSGFLVGPLIKQYGYRKMGFLGAALSSFALMLTSFTHNSMTSILITYSFVGGLGFGLSTAATFVALNTYFVRRRGQAVGLAMAGTALGFMTMPQIISRLLEEFDFNGTMLILSAISLNAIVGASLLQPVKWHMKSVPVPLDKESLLVEEKEDLNKLHENGDENNEASTSLLGLPRNASLGSSMTLQRQNSQNKDGGKTVSIQVSQSCPTGPRKRKTSTISNVSHLDLMGSTMHVHVETDSEDEDHELKNVDSENGNLKSNNNIVKETKKPPIKEESYWQRFSNVMDFDLLLDISYLNILFGLSITYIAELSFKLIIPFFMANMGYSKRETAQALSVMAIADITARIVMPPIYDKLGYSRRGTLMVGLILVSIARSVLAEQTSWTNLMIVIVIHGFFRGFTLINFPLVISEAVASDKFAAAFGLSMVSKGIFIVVLGPVVGWIRDYSGSYPLCLHAQSLMMMSCVLAWFIEYLITMKKKPKSKKAAAPS